MRAPGRLVLSAVAAVLAAPAQAACPDTAAVFGYLTDYAAHRPSKGFGKDLTAADAACARTRLIATFTAVMGQPIGYKALFTNPQSQQRFAMDGPAWGAMFDTLQADGARLPAAFGAVPRFEADFVVVVKDPALAEAADAAAALSHIEAVVPFIELPDLMIEDSPTGLELVATNAAFRSGVLGGRIAVADPAAMYQALGAMQVVVEENGVELGREAGSALMGNPAEAALWLARALKEAGIALKPGDLLSLGGFRASAPAKAGSTITVRYLGLPGDPAVTVHFE
ncbi:MAG: 2-keto-4-pentenoate hydratase [Actinomycetota bacterium]